MKKHLLIVLGFTALLFLSGRNFFSNTFPSSGNAGIGTTTPAYPLDNEQGSYYQNANADVIVKPKTSAAGLQGLSFQNYNAAEVGVLKVNDGSGEERIGAVNKSYYLTFWSDSAEAMSINTGGTVVVDNALQTPKFALTTGAAAGYYMTSDANGVASWTAAGTTSSGTYVPTISATSNVAAYTNYGMNYLQVGKMVFIHWQISARGSNLTNQCTITFTLPVTNATAPTEANGGPVLQYYGTSSNAGVSGISDNTHGIISFYSLSTSAQPIIDVTLTYALQ